MFSTIQPASPWQWLHPGHEKVEQWLQTLPPFEKIQPPKLPGMGHASLGMDFYFAAKRRAWDTCLAYEYSHTGLIFPWSLYWGCEADSSPSSSDGESSSGEAGTST